jgi:RNA polymerase-binding transcription factor DksA
MPDPTNELTPPSGLGLQIKPGASETEQILGNFHRESGRESIKPDWRKYYDRLTEIRDRLIDGQIELDARAREQGPKVLQDSLGEVGTEEFQRERLLAMRTFEQVTLEEIEAALMRIREGIYGVCELTGEPIPEERLMAMPWARYTVAAQERLEETGQFQSPKLGSRSSARDRRSMPPSPSGTHEDWP